jgi:hypothetical protein
MDEILSLKPDLPNLFNTSPPATEIHLGPKSCPANSILAQHQICSKAYPYLLKGKNGVDCCFQTNDNNENNSLVKAYPDIIQSVSLGQPLTEIIQNIIKYRLEGRGELLQQERNKLLSNDLLNIVIFDIQTTGTPHILENPNTKTQYLSYPAITQFSFYHPKTGRHLTHYVKPHKPISFEAAMLSGLYNSFSIYFDLPLYPEKCDPRALEELNMVTYVNQTLLDRDDIKDIAAEIRELEPKLTDEEVGELAIQQFLTDIELYPIKSLEDELPLHELVEEIFEFIEKGQGENTKTIFLAHNGSRWAEPIFRAEMERVCCSDRLEDIIFLDTKELFDSILKDILDKAATNPALIRGINLSDKIIEEIDLRLGEKRVESFNSIIDSVDLWIAIQYCSDKLYGKSDFEFIASKILEEIYAEQQKQE